ncbi:pyridoxamine 5'-phosphate oxidase [Oceanimonas pelagia]|uniref:Pyridoxamine 5'-phosphate oxidase n=1 Tax=Oceanimonas pelagia TaxID=3028314 RepID=A0AA50Q993_9GAMM|nr:pyridoxamine 5'-phosphate oxidase [Oceanimonas pelagia]WMC09848.1 pyridoxamine 5'-phosphate oxidase [Oceanimonas pelagia]
MSELELHRQRILQGGLTLSDLHPNPFQQLAHWLQQAKDSGIRYPNAISLSTVDSRGIPYQRMVMMRQFDEQGLVFFTSLGSRKAEHLATNQNASILLPWHMLERQVHVVGIVQPLGKLEIIKYFASRTKQNQLAAWLSDQPSPVSKRGVLEAKMSELRANFGRGEVSLPPFWGGYRLLPESFEFWQTGTDHINERFIYRQSEDGWQLGRFNP